MIITISGNQGAGKKTIAKKLAEKLGYKNISVGDLRGEIAIEHNMTIDELNEIGKIDDWVHKKADQKIINIGKEKDNFVIDGWIAYHFIPHSYKIFLEVDEIIGTKRIFQNQRPDEKACNTIEELKEMLKIRLNMTREQLQKYYGVNFLNKSNYDYILDTSNLTPEEVINKIKEKIPYENQKNL